MEQLRLTPADSYLSYLPSAHSFEMALFSMALYTGCKVGYFCGNIAKLVGPDGDIAALKPTLFATVPRLLNKIYGKISAGVAEATGCKKCLLTKGFAAKKARFDKGQGTPVHGCWDKIVFKNFKNILGGNVKQMVTGSAPIAGETLDFLKQCFCININ